VTITAIFKKKKEKKKHLTVCTKSQNEKHIWSWTKVI